MEWLMLVVFGGAGGAGAYAASRIRTSRDERRRNDADLAVVRQLADEDVTVFGEQLARLGEQVEGRELDEETRADYQLALDAYEHAKFDAPRLREVDQISSLVDTLASGRYALVCVRARMAGQPVPEQQLPCFFNPQHGPSSRKVMWTSPRTGTRTVPACDRCATQLAAREKPEVRTVSVGGRRVPYWEAGVSQPYGRGYFPEGSASSATMAWMFHQPAALAAGGAFYSGSIAPSDYGGYAGFEGGAGDGGGGDGGGGN